MGLSGESPRHVIALIRDTGGQSCLQSQLAEWIGIMGHAVRHLPKRLSFDQFAEIEAVEVMNREV